MIEEIWMIWAPVVLLSLTALFLSLHESIGAPPGRVKKGSRQSLALFAMIALVIAAALQLSNSSLYFPASNGELSEASFSGLKEKMAYIFALFLLFSHFFVILVSSSYLKLVNMEKGEQYALILISTVLVLLLIQSQELLVLCVVEGILMMIYIGQLSMSYLNHREAELTAKMSFYSLIWLLLMGLALALLSFEFPSLTYLAFAESFSSQWGISQVAALLVLMLLLMQVCFFPFSLMQTDVAHGSPSYAFLLKSINSLLIFSMILVTIFDDLHLSVGMSHFLKILAALSFAFVAIITYYQKDLDRSFVFLMISQVPVLLILFLEHTDLKALSVQFIMFLLIVIPSSIVLMTVRGAIIPNKSLAPSWEHWSGLGHHYPWLSFALLVNLASLAGIPASSGFQFRLHLLQKILQAQDWFLFLSLFVANLFTCYFVGRFLFFLFAKKPDQRRIHIEVTIGRVLVIALITILNLGISFSFSWWQHYFEGLL